MSDASQKPLRTPIDLELINKQQVIEQTREINRGLTRLKKISSNPEPAPEKVQRAPMEKDTTGSFIVVPVQELQAKELEDAYVEAEKLHSSAPAKKEKVTKKGNWFKWKSS